MANPNEFNQPVSFLNGGPFETTWGPYATKEAACLALKNEVDADGRNMRSGKIVAIGTVTDYVEHAWQGGFEDEDLKQAILSSTRAESGKNKFNINDKGVQEGHYVSSATGATTVNENYNSTGFIPVVAGYAYTVSYKNQIAWYDANKNHISGSNITDTNKTQIAPANAVYLRATVALSEWATFQVEHGVAQTGFEPYSEKMVLSAGDTDLYADYLTNKAIEAVNSRIVVSSDKILPKAVGVDKVDFIADEPGKNKFNINDPTNEIDHYVSAATGAITANGTYNATHLIAVTGGATYRLSYKNQIAWYTANMAYITGSNAADTNRSQTAPANASYVRATVLKANWALFQISLSTDSNPDTYEPYKTLHVLKKGTESVLANDLTQSLRKSIIQEVNGNIEVSTERIQKGAVTAEKISFVKPETGKNKFNPNDADARLLSYMNAGVAVPANIGVITSNSSYHTTGFIPVTPGKAYYINKNARTAVFFSSARIPNAGAGIDNPTSAGPLIAGQNDAYIRYSIAVASWSTFQVEEGQLTDYEPYKEFEAMRGVKLHYSDLIDAPTSFQDDFLLFLPSEICVAVDRTIEIYNAQVSWCGNINNYHFFWQGVGACMERKWSLKGTVARIGTYTLTLDVYDNNMKLVASASTTVRVVSNVIANSVKIMPWGDSLSNYKLWQSELVTLSNNKISLVGTRWGSATSSLPYRHEGRSGMTAAYYLGNNSYTFDSGGIAGIDGRAQNLNPFWNPATNSFDFNYYRSNYDQSPDELMLWLGTNGAQLDPTVEVANQKALIDGIRASAPNMRIFVVLTLFRASQNGIGVQTSVDGYTGLPEWKLRADRKIFNLQVALYNALKNYTNLYFIPVSICHDSAFNFGAVPTPVNPRASQTELMPIEATHPQAQGYLQIADIMFSVKAAHQ